jgi:16S rRNA (cytidine1402-2'-O)-methyltransferase
MTPAEEPLGRLVVCPTPIGNLEDVTLRVLRVLGEADVVAAEDTRHTRVLLKRHGLAVPLVSFHAHNEHTRTGELLARIRGGALVALVSDAGTPVVSDPGFALVRACLAEGLPVEVLPGPSAVVTALVASGLPAERWLFVGFLPRKRAELEDLLVHASETLVAFESPRRLAQTLRVLATRDPERPVAVCRELTKRHEEVRRGSAAQLAGDYGGGQPAGHAAERNAPRGLPGQARRSPDPSAAQAPVASLRGEVVLIIGAAGAGRPRRDEALAALGDLVNAGARARPAARAVARLTGVPVNELYRELTSGGQ